MRRLGHLQGLSPRVGCWLWVPERASEFLARREGPGSRARRSGGRARRRPIFLGRFASRPSSERSPHSNERLPRRRPRLNPDGRAKARTLLPGDYMAARHLELMLAGAVALESRDRRLGARICALRAARRVVRAAIVGDRIIYRPDTHARRVRSCGGRLLGLHDDSWQRERRRRCEQRERRQRRRQRRGRLQPVQRDRF